MLQQIFFIRDPGTGRRLALATISRDIAERKRTEEELRRAQAELARVTRELHTGQITGGIAHEIDKALSAIVTNGNACLRFLSLDAPGPDGTREAVESMISEARRAGEMIRGVLDE
jgi:C4-dicarboxylate-specific signal transduction histidine kinase